jgi:hypothetical protein
MNKVMNGSGQGLRRFKLMNGQRYWIDSPTDEWHQFDKNPSYKKRNKSNGKTQLSFL